MITHISIYYLKVCKDIYILISNYDFYLTFVLKIIYYIDIPTYMYTHTIYYYNYKFTNLKN